MQQATADLARSPKSHVRRAMPSLRLAALALALLLAPGPRAAAAAQAAGANGGGGTQPLPATLEELCASAAPPPASANGFTAQSMGALQRVQADSADWGYFRCGPSDSGTSMGRGRHAAVPARLPAFRRTHAPARASLCLTPLPPSRPSCF